jgi:hypothetical protein
MADAGGASALLVYTPYAADPLARLSCCLTKRAYGLQSLD